MSEEVVKAALGRFGHVLKWQRPAPGNRPVMYAFVTFASEGEANCAIQAGAVEVEGRILQIKQPVQNAKNMSELKSNASDLNKRKFSKEEDATLSKRPTVSPVSEWGAEQPKAIETNSRKRKFSEDEDSPLSKRPRVSPDAEWGTEQPKAIETNDSRKRTFSEDDPPLSKRPSAEWGIHTTEQPTETDNSKKRKLSGDEDSPISKRPRVSPSKDPQVIEETAVVQPHEKEPVLYRGIHQKHSPTLYNSLKVGHTTQKQSISDLENMENATRGKLCEGTKVLIQRLPYDCTRQEIL